MNDGCVSEDKLLELLEQQGQAPKALDEAEDAHVAGCPSCAARLSELQAVIAAIAPEGDEFHRPQFVRTIAESIETKPKARARVYLRRRVWVATAMVMAAAAAWAIIVPSAPTHDDGFAARGGSAGPMSKSSVAIFRTVQHRADYEPISGPIRPNDALLFAVYNRPGSPYHYLAIVAFDDADNVFWYYPDRDQESSSIPIATSDKPQELRQEIVYALRPGALRVIAIFTATPWSVDAIERPLREQLKAQGGIRSLADPHLDGAGLQTVLLRVEDPS